MDIFFSITSVIRNISLILTTIFALLLLYIVFKSIKMLANERHHVLHPTPQAQQTPEQEISIHQDAWSSIKKFSQSMTSSEWKISVIEADKLVDDVLKSKGYVGDSMGERLMSIDPSRFLTLQDVWDAHKLRNIIVHDMNQVISKEQAVNAIYAYERFLQELGFFA